MISKQEQADLRSTLFRHLDGIVTAPTAYALFTAGVTDYLLENKEATLDELCEKFTANSGYLNVALRICASQGWLIQTVDNNTDEVSYKLTQNGEVAFNHLHLYQDVVHLLKSSE